VTWTHETARNVRDEQILQMSNDGMKQVDIAKKFRITKGRVYQILQKMKKDDAIVAKMPPLNRDRRKV
jgi:Mor family transcriptional regulator